MTPNPHKGEVALVKEGFPELLLHFDGNAYAALETAWDTSMQGVIDKISNWSEKTLRLGDLGVLLVALASRNNPELTKQTAMDMIGFPVPDQDVMAKMMEAVRLSLPTGGAKPPKPPKKPARGTGTKP